MSNSIEILIVGQGLAGTLLGRALEQRGVDFAIIDAPLVGELGASRIAGAIINPLPGRRLTLPPNYEQTLPTLQQAYPTGAGGYTPQPLLRIFRSDSERQAAARRRQQEVYRDWLGADHLPGQNDPRLATGLRDHLCDDHGGVWVNGGGVLDAAEFLDRQREAWHKAGRLHESLLDAHSVRVQSDGIQADDWLCRRLIFCDGWRVRHNPWFGWLAVTPLKGEILSFISQVPLGEVPLIRRHWLLPVDADQHSYRIGATYERDFSNKAPSGAGRQAMLSALNEMLPGLPAVEVVDHQAGIRPGNSTNLPFIGWHPKHPALGAFNGLGSRGALLGPFYAAALADHIAHGTALPPEADLAGRGSGA